MRYFYGEIIGRVRIPTTTCKFYPNYIIAVIGLVIFLKIIKGRNVIYFNIKTV